MSKVSVTGAKRVMPEVVETIHDLNLVHLSDYDGRWEGFDPGDPVAGADAASDTLVTVRSLQSILGVTEGDAGPTRVVTDEALESDLPEIRATVNELDDRRAELEDDLRAVEERIEAVEPFVDLGIDLDLLGGYDSLEVAVGDSDPAAVERAVADADGVEAFETFAEDGVVAVFVQPRSEQVLDDVLVGVDFDRHEVPDAEGPPSEYVDALRREREEVADDLADVEDDLEALRHEHAGFLLAAEETLTIRVQKAEAPLQFATTEHAFVAEGWIPTERYTDLAAAMKDAVGDRLEVEEVERAEYADHGHAGNHGGEGGDTGAAATDGGQPTTVEDSPPVVQDNPDVMGPFELLVQTINLPKYSEFDPTVVLFVTFPVFFGFMIGDFGYGALYTALGYYLYSRFDSDALRSLGGIALWAGGFTMLFGLLYGEVFGLHQLGEIVWGGHPPIHKGLAPHFIAYAKLWLTLSLLAGLLHLTVGYALDFGKNLAHGLWDAVTESGSWIVLMVGIWVWVFSRSAQAVKPPFLFEVLNGNPFPLGFAGFSPTIGIGALVVGLALGLPLLLLGEGGIGLLESLNVLVNVLSYTRLAAVLLAKAGMALVVNLLVFGAALEEGEFHFLWFQGGHVTEAIFGGLFNMNVAGLLVGLVILVLGHGLVLVLGITSAGLQAVRLEYVEFFGKFYEGGGVKYEPFGYQQTHTTED